MPGVLGGPRLLGATGGPDTAALCLRCPRSVAKACHLVALGADCANLLALTEELSRDAHRCRHPPGQGKAA